MTDPAVADQLHMKAADYIAQAVELETQVSSLPHTPDASTMKEGVSDGYDHSGTPWSPRLIAMALGRVLQASEHSGAQTPLTDELVRLLAELERAEYGPR